MYSKRNRRSIRLKGYDYSRAGAYFVTICTHNRECLFGTVADGKMVLNDQGRMVEKWVGELQNKFPDIRCDDSIIMPNHFHAIIQNVGADLRVCPDLCFRPDSGIRPDPCVCPDPGIRPDRGVYPENEPNETTRVECTPCESPPNERMSNKTMPGEHTSGEHIGSPLHRVVQWFKTMTTNEYIRGVKQFNWTPFHRKLWQRNYYEHIIRNEKELNRIRDYIVRNPRKWEWDRENPDRNRERKTGIP